MNNIYRIVLFFLLFLISLGASSYDVQLGSFRNYNGLTASLSKIKNDTYKHKISIEQKGDLFYVYSRGYDNNAEAQNALHFYKKIFKDAFIKETIGNISHRDSYHQTLSQKQSWQNIYARSSPIQNVSTELPNRKQNFSFADQLKRKVFYLCYEGKKRGAVKPVVKAVFNQNFITYSSETINIPPIVTYYRLINNDLYISVGMFNVTKTRSRLVSVTDKYLRTANWADGKRVQDVRLYFNKRDAIAFANIP